jgi:type IV pilus assembly protein PilV
MNTFKLPQSAHAAYGARRSRGATLVEVLVAVLLVSFGLVAMTGMQLFSVAASKNAVNRGLATELASEVVDSMRANPLGFSGRNYELASTFDKDVFSVPSIGTPCAYPNCTAAQLASRDLLLFQQHVRAALPAGGLQIQIVGTAPTPAQQVDVWIMWVEAGAVQTTNAAITNTEANIDDCPPDVAGARCLRVRVNI